MKHDGKPKDAGKTKFEKTAKKPIKTDHDDKPEKAEQPNDAKSEAPKPVKARSEKASRKPVPVKAAPAEDEDSEGWNGPVPGFLDAKLNR